MDSPRDDIFVIEDKVEGSCGDSKKILIRVLSLYLNRRSFLPPSNKKWCHPEFFNSQILNYA